jgi:hypothetical protein
MFGRWASSLLAGLGVIAGLIFLLDGVRTDLLVRATGPYFLLERMATKAAAGNAKPEFVLMLEHFHHAALMVASGVVLAGLLALVLGWRGRDQGATRWLRDSLAVGAGALGYAMALHPRIVEQPYATTIAVLACMGMAYALWAFGRFAAEFPTPLDASALPTTKMTWFWGDLMKRSRETGIPVWRLILSSFGDMDPRRAWRFLETGERTPNSTGSNKNIVDQRLHRILQGRTWLLFLMALAAVTALTPGLERPWSMIAALAAAMVWVFAPLMIYLPLNWGYWELNYARGDADQRRALRWMLSAVFLSILILFVAFYAWVVPSLIFGEGESSGMGAMLVLLVWGVPGPWFMLLLALIASVFLRGAVEPALVLSRGVLAGALAVVVTTVFVVLENLLQTHVIQALGLPEQTAAIVTGVVLALVFGPVKRKVEGHMDGWLGRVMPDQQSSPAGGVP